MGNVLKRFFGRGESPADPNLLREERRELRVLAENSSYATAARAFATVLPFVRELDPDCRLKFMMAPQGTDDVGVTHRWEFAFDLPARRAQARATWFLEWDDAADDFKTERVEVIGQPFLPARVMAGYMISEQQANLRWEEERRRQPDLPHQFVDSDAAVAEVMRQGLDYGVTEFTLHSAVSEDGKFLWVAEGRSAKWETSLVLGAK